MSDFKFLKPEKVTMYKTTDGETFESRQAAANHQMMLECNAYISGDELYWGCQLNIGGVQELQKFLSRNEIWIHLLMGWHKESKDQELYNFVQELKGVLFDDELNPEETLTELLSLVNTNVNLISNNPKYRGE